MERQRRHTRKLVPTGKMKKPAATDVIVLVVSHASLSSHDGVDTP